jgi:surfeit locus 1 family protein
MGIHFRPYPGFTIMTILMVTFLSGLGVWQLERLQWKLGLIADTDRSIHAPAISLDTGVAPRGDYVHVSVTGYFLNAKEAYVFTTADGGAPVYHVLTPFVSVRGQTFMADRGLVPTEKLEPATRSKGLISGVTRLTGIWRRPDAPGVFTPVADPAKRIWYARDLKAIAAVDHVSLAAPVVIEADATPNPGGWPVGGQTVVDFPNNHLSYAVTWFGLALGLLGVYLAYHISKGRLGWKRA